MTLAPIPYYEGPFQYAARAWKISRAIQSHYHPGEAAILRVPSQLATCAASVFQRRNHPFGVEVAGDPSEAFAPGAVRHAMRPFFRRWYARHQQEQCAASAAVLYVAEYLKDRYPAAASAFSVVCSDVHLPAAAYASAARVHARKEMWILMTVGSLAQMYKGVDVLLDALALAVRTGLNLQLTVVGDGKHRAELEARAAALALTARVHFLGQLSRFTGSPDPVMEQLDAADLFILPSKTEGLPRALLEAMARALPCIGSAVGGIPELLEPEDLVPAGSAAALAERIAETLADPARLDRMSARNLARAAAYQDSLLAPRRDAFLRSVRDARR